MAEYIERDAVSADGCDEVSKIKTPFAWIIVEGTADKPYYSILWWDTAKKECNVGYSSYYLEYVFNWLKEEFEITEEDADVAPVLHGRWEWFEEWYPSTPDSPIECEDCGWRCSECQTALEDMVYGIFDDPYDVPKLKFCPNCGAKMDLEDTE